MAPVDSKGKPDEDGRCLLGGQAFVVAAASGLASLAYTDKWFDSEGRGIFMISMAVLALFVRVVVGCIFATDSGSGGNLLITRLVLVTATLSDAAFDILQGASLIAGVEYDFDANKLVILGTWLHFSNAGLDFFKDMLAAMGDWCQGLFIFGYWILLIALAITAQCFNIYSMYSGNLGQELKITGYVVSGIMLLVAVCVVPCAFVSIRDKKGEPLVVNE